MKDELKNGVSLFIFPEGAFNESEKILKPFQDGAFKLSIDCNIPVLPVVFPDTARRLNHKSVFSFSAGISRSVILEAIGPERFGNYAELKRKVFETMENALLYYRENG